MFDLIQLDFCLLGGFWFLIKFPYYCLFTFSCHHDLILLGCLFRIYFLWVVWFVGVKFFIVTFYDSLYFCGISCSIFYFWLWVFSLGLAGRLLVLKSQLLISWILFLFLFSLNFIYFHTDFIICFLLLTLGFVFSSFDAILNDCLV